MKQTIVKLLPNNETENHLKEIKGNLILYNEAYFAVAFLKMSGLNKIIQTIKELLKSGGKIIIIAGQNFALTEPEALHALRKLFQLYKSSKLYLAKAHSANIVFHQKLYLFKSSNDCCIISGSANITEGGLVNNKETSLMVTCNEADTIWNDAKKYFDSLLNPDSSDEASLLVIKQYETFFEQQKQHNKKSKPIPTKTKSQIAFDYENLFKHFQKFDISTREDIFKNKTIHYKKARKVLDEIADSSRLTQKQFEPLLDKLVGSKDEHHLWHSGSLFRLRRRVYPYYREFRELVRYIRENKSLKASVVSENAKRMVNKIEGAAVNYITEIMMTYNSKDFANLNNNPITVLRTEAGVNIKAASSSYTSSDYEEFCDLVKEISAKFGLQNMLEADSFFNDIYWKIK